MYQLMKSVLVMMMEVSLFRMNTETWKDVVGYSGLYSVSDQGRVMSLERKVKHSDGFFQLVNSRIMKPANDGNGYMNIGLNRDGIKKSFKVHSLVLTAFIGDRPNGFNASHIDGSRDNNILSNLQWESVSSNNIRKRDHGTWQGGESIGTSKLKDGDVRKIKEMIASGKYIYKQIAELFGVSATAIGRIKRNQNWSHIN